MTQEEEKELQQFAEEAEKRLAYIAEHQEEYLTYCGNLDNDPEDFPIPKDYRPKGIRE